jgi:hypothetical protein
VTVRLLTLAILFLARPAFAQTSYPMITHCTPVAVQRGTTAEVTVEGQMNFAGVHKVLVEGNGVSAEVISNPPAKGQAAPTQVRSVKIRVRADADAAVGVREFRVASTLGISTLGQLLVVAEPVVLESSDNNTPDRAQRVTPPCVVSGRIEVAEDVDCFRFAAKARQTFTFDVVCARIQDKIHDLQKHADPMLVLLDSAGKELAASDDGTFADPLLTFTIPKDGDYVIQVRDARYDGDPRWAYALRITDGPCVSQLFPMAGNPGQTIEVEPVGSASTFARRLPLKVPSETGITAVSLDVGGRSTNPAAFVVTRLPLVTEREPNDTPSQATRLPIPGGANGRIGKKRDLDHYVFHGTKGKAVRLEVFARRFGTDLTSQLDAVMDVLSPTGAILASNDDTFGKDPMVIFTPPADGDFVVRLRDLNSKGGEGFVYYLEADWATPDFTLKCDPSKAMIGPGSRTAWYVIVNRTNGFTGPVKVQVNGLPKGVTVNRLTIPANMTQGLLVVSAAADAPVDAAAVEIVGTADVAIDGKPTTLTRKATAVEEIYLPGGGRGRFDVRMQAVAVTGPSDVLDVQVKPEKLVLKPGDEMKLEVTIKRRQDFDKPVFLDVPLRHLGTVYASPLPPGVTLVEGKSKTSLGAGNTGYVTLKLDAGAALVEDVPICVLAHVSINFVVKVSYASAPVSLSIRK